MKEGSKEKGPKARTRPDSEGNKDPGPSEKPAWKRMAKAIFIALAVDAAFLATLTIPVVGFILVLMLGPYGGALIGGRYLHRARKGEWLWATFWVALILPSALVGMMLFLIRTLGSFSFVLDMYGMAIIAALYTFPTAFTLAGFYQGSVVTDDDEDGLPKKMPVKDTTEGSDKASEDQPEEDKAPEEPPLEETEEPAKERPAEKVSKKGPVIRT